MTKSLFVLFLSAIFGVHAGAFEDVTLVNKWIGKTADPTHEDAAPESGIVVDAESFAQLWEKWHPGEAVPEIDFSKDMVVAMTVGGPNRMMVGDQLQMLEGDLKVNAAATRMGGPGFGHALLQVPRVGIKSVNGNEVPAANGRAVEDSIHVDVVGTLTTGMMAIGGETTGTTVTSGNITWEMDVPENLSEAAEAFNGKKALVKGRLVKKAGVEIRERWIIMVDSISDPDAEKDCGFESIKMVQSGGFAGVSITTTLDPNGNLTRQDRSGNVTRELGLEVLAQLKEHLTETDWSSVPASTRAANVADDFQFDFEIIMGNESYQFVVDGTKLGEVAALKKLMEWMQ